jgi:hypothetical protein
MALVLAGEPMKTLCQTTRRIGRLVKILEGLLRLAA